MRLLFVHVDFFSTEAIAAKIDAVLNDKDSKHACLPAQQRLVEQLANVSAARQAA
jgi:hypothetical protein